MPIASIETVINERFGPRRPRARPPSPFVLLDDSLSPDGSCTLFEEPVEIVRCDRAEEAEPALRALARGLARGLTAAGFLAYELGYLLEPKLAALIPAGREQPLLWMGLFERRQRLDGAAARRLIAARTQGGHELGRPRLSLDRAAYLAALGRVKDYIAAGDVYQINLTFKYLFDFAGDPLSLYGELRRKQRVAHGAVIRTPDFDVLSLSPELFLSISDGRVLAKPMKGTAARRPTPAQDERQRAWLRGDGKSRAENLMIVDLLRNDLGRVAEIGSVRVPDLFTVETYPTVHQMTSSVTARLRPGVGVRELIRSLFPCGSITGAPKVRAMEIIRELEPLPRGVYTGAIGMIAPDGEVALNVAIRTLVLHRDGRGEMGIGSGIVSDSDPQAEFEECLLKARFLSEPFRPFRLIETLRWTPGDGYCLLERHMARLAASAAHFGFRCDLAAVRRALEDRAAGFAGDVRRVRLLLDEDGEAEVSAAPLTLPGPDAVLRYAVSDRPVDRDDPFFYHKTTRREFHDGELARLQAATGCDEVLLVNDRGELTEGSRTNLFVERDGRLLTPPVACGLLDGTLRRTLLDDPAVEIEERVLTPADLAAADRVFLGNSVRGLVRARPVE
ncbi:MAG: aminodeoxychorismate synthase component I [Kiloniellaceae bacterium]